ncbi:serine/threonine-protein kinase [Nakamurella lactea]|uniref:serine/threonine-protein kinase n=1 Tax=Nakamurella lactea TaxID=459515 RepID=UPI00056CD6C7
MAAVSEPRSPQPPRYLAGRYRLEATIGRGAMGTVWRAYDDVVHRRVAIKEINFPAGMPAGEVGMLTDRTLREARAIGALSHPHVITLFDILTVEGRPFIVMELLDARSLAEVLKQDGPLRPGAAGTIGVAVAGGLRAAHDAGITHRDVKPGNVLVGNDGRIKLTDFGIARSADEPTMTVTGLLLGSPAYISPEVASGAPASPMSDAWGLGAMLFATVEGRPPFDRGEAIPTLTAVVAEPVPPHPHSGSLGPIIDGLLRKDPNARMTVAEAGRRLREVADDPTGMRAELARMVPVPAGRAGTGTASPPVRVPVHPPVRRAATPPVQPPPPWAGSNAAPLPALPATADRPGRPGWLLPVAALVVIAAAAVGYFVVRLIADWGGQV